MKTEVNPGVWSGDKKRNKPTTRECGKREKRTDAKEKGKHPAPLPKNNFSRKCGLGGPSSGNPKHNSLIETNTTVVCQWRKEGTFG